MTLKPSSQAQIQNVCDPALCCGVKAHLWGVPHLAPAGALQSLPPPVVDVQRVVVVRRHSHQQGAIRGERHRCDATRLLVELDPHQLGVPCLVAHSAVPHTQSGASLV